MSPTRSRSSRTRSALLILLLLSPFFGELAVADLGRWTTHGPYGADVAALAIDPRTPSTLYAETEAGPELSGKCQGVFRSTDGGASWTSVSRGLAQIALCVNAVAIDPQKPSTLCLATDGGMFRSADGGETWTPVVSEARVFTVVHDPQVSGTVRVVFLSSPHKTPHPFFQQPDPMVRFHAEIERLIVAAGLESTFTPGRGVRPGDAAKRSRRRCRAASWPWRRWSPRPCRRGARVAWRRLMFCVSFRSLRLRYGLSDS